MHNVLYLWWFVSGFEPSYIRIYSLLYETFILNTIWLLVKSKQLSWWFYTWTLVLRMLIQKGIKAIVFSHPTILFGILFFFPPGNFSLYIDFFFLTSSLYIDVIIYNEVLLTLQRHWIFSCNLLNFGSF